jgi:hypothetical protein
METTVPDLGRIFGDDAHSPLLDQAAELQLVNASRHCSFVGISDFTVSRMFQSDWYGMGSCDHLSTSHMGHIPGLEFSSVRDVEENEEISNRR